MYAAAVDHTSCFLNSGPVPNIVFVQHGEERKILSQEVYDQLVNEATP